MTVFEGNTVEDAVAAGLKQLARTRDQVTIELVTAPKKGFLGIGKQAAQVRLTVKPQAAPKPAVTKMPAKKPVQAKAPVKPVAKPVVPVAPVVTKAKTPTPKPKPVVARAQPAPVKSVMPVKTPAQIAARQAANEQAVRDLSAYLLKIVKQLGITADLDVDFGNRYALLNFDTAKQGLLIGKHGRTINALQDLAQVYMNHHGASHVNVSLDVDDYRERRAETLQRLAENTAREVIATGKQVFLDPMPSFERKLIHAELADNHHVTTFSAGRDPHRAVVVAIRK
ncbi:single-stranded DNA-binding protein [Lactobacillus sp. CBA3606]|uniref:RNA-binding cell elongation regulator Jag/EloR n=1 Tax=Lactobacillus sp. CBA3606 TaxID=2099789 RepID=UPI000CFB86EE|nr:RNA-binding cell elongation regulator Jag/EloR [Lactobacillus sp. CBA3606]AVK64075.1 single-stranded DNA-binding protein [Lactobacillus sp. CBA3606]